MNGNAFTLLVPPSFRQERHYLARIVFDNYLGIPYKIQFSDDESSTYTLSRDGKEIVFDDCFFSTINDNKGYINELEIPGKVSFVNSDYCDNDLVVFYGSGNIITDETRIHCGIDIFASVFFMVTRWEEFINTDADFLGRFPAQSSLAYRFNFLHRPVVNEWIEFLRKIIQFLFPGTGFTPKQKFGIVFTHDIDFLNAPVSIREFAKDILKRKSVHAFNRRLKYLVSKDNPYDLFDFFMDVSERNGSVSHFYFMTGHNVPGKDGEDYNRSRRYMQVLKRIKERGHKIGFHPSLLTYNNPSMFAAEKKRLEDDIGETVIEGRQHALRFKMPDTWRMWNEHGMKVDSTLGYSAHEGFRCGTGCAFPVFDFETREELELHEQPLVIMDTTLNVNRKLNIDESRATIEHYIEEARKHNMPITVLFHNLIADNIDWKGWKMLYEQVFTR